MSINSNGTSHSSFRVGQVEVRYEVREASPGRWNAVGVLYLGGRPLLRDNRCPLVVGVGPTSYEATADLLGRVLEAKHPELTVLADDQGRGPASDALASQIVEREPASSLN